MQVQARLTQICPDRWVGSCQYSEAGLHQIAPYIGKMKSTMARTLIETLSKPGDIILDPFAGSGALALESVIAGRGIVASDISPYAVLLTKAKINPPKTQETAERKALDRLAEAERRANSVQLRDVPAWVKSFFHPKTLKEIIVLIDLFKKSRDYFLLSCLLGILHHQRPGFLSFPASHLVPYLRTKKYPRKQYPELYRYRPVAPRLLAKIKRAYKRFPYIDDNLPRSCARRDAKNSTFKNRSIDVVITSPPYMNSLDYARDNRLRLWFLGINDYSSLDKKANTFDRFQKLMKSSLFNIHDSLKSKGICALVLGDVNRGRHRRLVNTCSAVTELAHEIGFQKIGIIQDLIPNKRRARREGRSTKREWILILRKKR